MDEQTFSIKLTAAQAWALRESYEAAFTDPGSRNEAELEVSAILDTLAIKVHRSKVRSRA